MEHTEVFTTARAFWSQYNEVRRAGGVIIDCAFPTTEEYARPEWELTYLLP